MSRLLLIRIRPACKFCIFPLYCKCGLCVRYTHGHGYIKELSTLLLDGRIDEVYYTAKFMIKKYEQTVVAIPEKIIEMKLLDSMIKIIKFMREQGCNTTYTFDFNYSIYVPRKN